MIFNGEMLIDRRMRGATDRRATGSWWISLAGLFCSLLATAIGSQAGENLWKETATLQHTLDKGMLNQPGTRILAEYVPASDQRPAHAPQNHQPGDGFDLKASLTYTLLDETLSGSGTSADDWRSGGTEAVQAIAQDVVSLGPFAALHRFESLERKNAALEGADGLLGLSFSAKPDSASLLQTLFHHQRASWHVEQPPSFRDLRPRLFAIAVGEHAGELQLGGYDPAALAGGEAALQFIRMRPGSGYAVRVQSLLYGKHTIAEDIGLIPGSRPPLEAEFDTGSTCVMLPDRAVGGAKGSLFRRVLDAHAREGEQALELVLADDAGGQLTLRLPYEAWTHPHGCLGPYEGARIVLGQPVFRGRVVVHDLGQAPFKLGLAPLAPAYPLPVDPVYPLPPSGPAAGSLLVLPAKVPLALDGGQPPQRYLVGVGVGTPVQQLTMVLDTGAFLTQVHTCAPCPQHPPPPPPPPPSLATHHAHAHGRAPKTPPPPAPPSKAQAAARVGELARRLARSQAAAPLSGGASSFQMWGMLVMGMLVAAVIVSEIRRRNALPQPRFRLVEYEAVEGEPSRFEFSDL